MLLNDLIMENRVLMNRTFKTKVLSSYAHFEKGDRQYIENNISRFVPDKSTDIIFPALNGAIPPYLSPLFNRLKMENYNVRLVDVVIGENQLEIIPLSSIVISKDIYVLAGALDKTKSNTYALILAIANMCWRTGTDLYSAYITVAAATNSSLMKSFLDYVDCMHVLAFSYDVMSTLRFSYELHALLENQSISTQTEFLKASIEDFLKNPNTKKIRGLLFLELNILTSVGFVETVEKRLDLVASARFAKEQFLEYPVEKELSDIMESIKRTNDPFKSPDVTVHQPAIRGYSKVNNNNRNIEDAVLVDNITIDKIVAMLDEKVGVLVDKDDITFDIPEELLSMFMLEFGKEYPIKLYSDGVEVYRHILSCEGTNMVCFHIKSVKKKLYAIRIVNGIDQNEENVDIVEFTGRQNMRYKFEY